MKKVLLSVVAVLSVSSFAFAQSAQSIQLAASSTQRAIIAAPGTLPAGTTTFTLPEVSSILISNTNTEEYNWTLGGNSSPFTNPYTNNLGTLSNDAINFITGAGGPNIRMTITGAGGIELTGDLDKINNLGGYNWPAAHQTGYLQNDGTGNLSWQTSVQASRAGLASWYKNNYGTGNQVIDVAGTDVPTVVSPFGGGLSGVSMKINPPGAGGTLIATVTKNNVATTLTVTINANGQSFAFTDISGAPIAFNPGDEIGVSVNDPGGFAPNTDIVVTVFANF